MSDTIGRTYAFPTATVAVGAVFLAVSTIAPTTATVQWVSAESTPEVIVQRRSIEVSDREMISIAREVIVSLIEDRDHLGHMVEHARGRIDDDTMDALSEEHAAVVNVDDATLRRKVLTLTALVGSRVSTELVSSVFHCDFFQAQRVLSSFQG